MGWISSPSSRHSRRHYTADVASLVTSSLLLLLAQHVTYSYAYPDGPPLSACRDMTPRTQMGELGLEGHTVPPQNEKATHGRSEAPPYYILIHPMPEYYEPNELYNVYVIANQTYGANAYRGVLLQARRLICYSNTSVQVEEDTVGSFTLPFTMTPVLETMDCNDQTDSAVSHNSRQWKINETATWRAPAHRSGHIVFWATIVQEDVTYWTKVHSLPMLDAGAEPLLTCGCVNTVPTTVVTLLLAICMTSWMMTTQDVSKQ